MTWAHHALLHDDREGLKWGLWLTIVLGMLFTCVQAYEYSHAAFGFKGNIYGATFFMATGFHGAHVIIGTIFLAVCLWRAYQGQFTPRQHLGFEFAAWYWHFVDVVWLFLFACIYVWAAGRPCGRRRPLTKARPRAYDEGRREPPFAFPERAMPDSPPSPAVEERNSSPQWILSVAVRRPARAAARGSCSKGS